MNSGDSNQNEGHWLNVESLYIIFLTLNNRWCVVQFKDKPIISCLHHPTSLPSFFLVSRYLKLWQLPLNGFSVLLLSSHWLPAVVGDLCALADVADVSLLPCSAFSQPSPVYYSQRGVFDTHLPLCLPSPFLSSGLLSYKYYTSTFLKLGLTHSRLGHLLLKQGFKNILHSFRAQQGT